MKKLKTYQAWTMGKNDISWVNTQSSCYSKKEFRELMGKMDRKIEGSIFLKKNYI